MLVRFDNELNDLDRDLKIKRQEIVDTELVLKKVEHDVGLLVKEKTGAVGLREGLERQFTWIGEEHQ